MDYLSRDGSKSYHFFINENTVCKMWKSGGMNTRRKIWRFFGKPPEGKDLCTMCQNNASK